MIGVMGAGAFGTALAVSLAQAGREIRLWGRDAAAMAQMQSGRENAARLPGVTLPENLHPVADADLLAEAEVILLAVPTQKLADLLRIYRGLLNGKTLVACNKGIDTKTLEGPSALIGQYCSLSHPAVLTGPSFAADIARGRPTALTLAYAWSDATRLQTQLSTPNLRLYLTDDLIGAELGGALKNVTAIACGAAMGAGLGESARAAVMTRGYAEMQRLALSQGARPETLGGLSGFGDLALTCTSDGSRNYRYGYALGSGAPLPQGKTVEGIHTATAMARLATKRGIEMPLCQLVADLVAGHISVDQAVNEALSRPLTKEA